MNARCIAAGFVAATTWFGAGAAAEEAESEAARKIIDRAIEAAGGREALKRYEKPFYMVRKGKALGGTGWGEFTIKVTTWLPEKDSIDQESTFNGKTKSLGSRFNGEKGWQIGYSSRGGTTEMNAMAVESTRTRLYFDWVNTLLPLDDAQFRLTLLDEIMVDERPAVGVKVSRMNQKDVELYFDKDAMTLVKQVIDYNGRLSERYYDDFAELDGLVYPKKLVHYVTGNKVTEMETTEFKFLDEADEAIFEKP
jgi:hypothetical protein